MTIKKKKSECVRNKSKPIKYKLVIKNYYYEKRRKYKNSSEICSRDYLKYSKNDKTLHSSEEACKEFLVRI
jgi:hypothetical protein